MTKTSPPSRVRRAAGNLLLLLVATLAALFALEGYVRWGTDADDILVEQLAGHAHLAGSRYQRSDDPFVLFEGRPNQSEVVDRGIGVQPGWTPEDHLVRMTSNAEGARGTPHQAAKPANTFRILFHGPSTLWGAYLHDEETLTVQMERHLNAALPDGPRVEVWNFGASAQTLAQSAYRAARDIERLDADLSLVMVTNVGRRTTLIEDAWTAGERMRTDPWAAVEYFVPPESLGPEVPITSDDPTRLDPAMPWKQRLFFTACRRSAVVRWAAAISTAEFMKGREGPDRPYFDAANLVHARAALRRAKELDVPMVLVSGPGPETHLQLLELKPPIALTVGVSGGEPVYKELHPPGWVMAFHAERLAHQLTQAGLVPGSVPRPAMAEPPADVEPIGPERPDW